MNFWLVAILSLCILVPAAIALIRFSKINRVYYPFIYCIWFGALVEMGSSILVFNGYSNAVVGNLYFLAESLVLTWQFRNWKLFEKRKVLFPIIFIALTISWIWENFIASRITYFNSYSRIIYSFLIVMMSITIINQLIITERKKLLKNASFLLCIAFVFYYTIQVIVEAFWVYGINDKSFSTNVYRISVITNFIANLLYTVAIIWIPTKQRFTLPSS